MALQSGVHRVMAAQDGLNRINVFPVADGDTGTNLSLTLGCALPVLAGTDRPQLGSLLATVSDALLDGARGNSGAIVAQFFQGLSDDAAELDSFDSRTFVHAIATGCEYARDALSDPQEGTILSVISAFSAELEQALSASPECSLHDMLATAVEAASRALAATERQLEVLRKAGVVDAGAKGFVELVSGMADHLLHGRPTPVPAAVSRPDESHFVATAGSDPELHYRFCVECLVHGDDIDRRKLRESLDELGNSLVLAGTKRKARVHIHANAPDQVFVMARRFGAVSGEKADDLARQQHSTHGSGAAFAVVTDSAADIPDDDLDRLDIHMVPARIQFGDRGYLDKVSITTQEFFRELDENPIHPTTSQPSPGDFRRQYQFLASHYPDVISINLTAKVSGTLQAARSAAARVGSAGRVHVVDSRNASVGQGLIVVFAAECAAAGVDAASTLAAIEKVRADTHTFALVRDLRYAVRGGRVPASRKLLADILRITPVLRTDSDGRITARGMLLGRGKRLPKFARHIAARVDRRTPLRVATGHAMCEDDAKRLDGLLREALGNVVASSITDLGSAFGVHGGPGTLVVALQPASQSILKTRQEAGQGPVRPAR